MGVVVSGGVVDEPLSAAAGGGGGTTGIPLPVVDGGGLLGVSGVVVPVEEFDDGETLSGATTAIGLCASAGGVVDTAEVDTVGLVEVGGRADAPLSCAMVPGSRGDAGSGFKADHSSAPSAPTATGTATVRKIFRLSTVIGSHSR